MRTFSRSLVVLLLASRATLGAMLAGPTSLPASAVSAAFGAGIGAQVLHTANGISLQSAALTLSTLNHIRSVYPGIVDPEKKAAATAVLVALSASPGNLPARLATTDLPPAAVARLQKVSAKLAAEAGKNPVFAAKVEASRSACAALVAHPENILPANLAATLRAFMDWGESETDEATPAVPAPTPVATPEAANSGEDWSKVDPKTILDPATRPQVKFGDAAFPVLAMPTMGDDISKLWTTAHDQSVGALIAMYNFDDLDMAQSIVAASKKGQKQVIVGDYSNWFPVSKQTPAMKLIIANLGPNLDLHILKGLGSIGINHNKFTVFIGPDGKYFFQGGSFNYTKTSQVNHWENVIFTDDIDRISFFKNYHAWILRLSRPYSPRLKPVDPVIDPKDPIPQDPSRSINFHGVPFPKATASPNGGTEASLVEAETLVQQTLDILMFAPYPTPKMQVAIEDLLDKKRPVRMLADRGQVGQAGKTLEPLLEKGMELKTIVGPDVVLHHLPWSESSKMHEKVMIFDGGMIDALAKMVDSLNISMNALMHNFENQQYLQGFHAAFMQAHFNMLWDLATPVDKDMLAKLAAEASAAAKTKPASAKKTPVKKAPAKKTRAKPKK